MYSRFAVLMLALAVCPSPPKVVGKYVKPGGNFLEVEAAPDDKVNVNLAGSYGMNTCQIDTGPQKISDCTITYTENEDGDNCTIRISFEGQIARVEQHGGCGCGLNVNLSGTYRKQRKVSEKGSNRSVPSREAG